MTNKFLKIALAYLSLVAQQSPVIINEALEIGGRFSGTGSVPFLNGVLDEVRKSLDEEKLAAIGSPPA